MITDNKSLFEIVLVIFKSKLYVYNGASIQSLSLEGNGNI